VRLGSAIGALTLLALGCSDRNLYSEDSQPFIPNKLTLDGVLCTDNPADRRFPVKILFVVDGSGIMREASPGGEHILAIQDIVNNNLPIPNVEFGFIRYDDAPESLIQVPQDLGSSGFTRDDALVEAALARLRQGAGLRETADAFSLARSVITGDAFQAERGPLSRTKYVMVHVTAGSPDPTIPSSRCNDRFDQPPPNCELALLDDLVREIRDSVIDLGAAEFNFHTVFVEPAAVEGLPCDPMAVGNCPAGQTCIQTGSTILSGRCVEPCDPAAPQCVTDPNRTSCNTITLPDGAGTISSYCARDELACFDGVDNDGDGDVDCADPSYPYNCNGNGCERSCRNACRLDEIGTRLSLVTGGRFDAFETSDQVNLSRIDFRSTQERFLVKEFIVRNRNVIPSEEGLIVDSDGDGLGDEEEDRLGLDPLFGDSDGDFYGDQLEVLFQPLGFDPLMIDTQPTCDDPALDRDGDGLRDCEEDLISSDTTLFDTDADGFPDLLEFRSGTNALFDDGLDDVDLDGARNGQEILANSDPLSNDGRTRASLEYRYRISDLGPQGQRQCYNVRVSNITLVETRDTGAGPGFNNIDIYFGQVPQTDLEGFALFKAATIRVRYLDEGPDGEPFRDPDTVILDLQDEDFVFVEP